MAAAPLLLLAALLAHPAAAQSCHSASELAASATCYGAVDYDFVVPRLSSKTLLNAAAASLAQANDVVPYLGADCLSAFKAAVCAETYRACNGTEPLPVCSSVCTAAESACPTLADGTPVLEALGVAPACGSEAAAECTAAAAVSVGTTAEPYVAGDSCADVLTDVFITPGVAWPLVAPLAAPYTVQALVESGVASALGPLPVSAAAACQEAAVKAACAKAFPLPVEADVFEGVSAWVPRPASETLCTAANTECASLIEVAATVGVDLSFDCSTYEPADEATVLVLDATPYGGYAVETEPYAMDLPPASEWEAVTECPTHFVVPENPERENIDWVTGTGCAAACPLAELTDSEIHLLETVALSLALLGVLGSAAVLGSYVLFRRYRRRRQDFVVGFVLVSLLYLLAMLPTFVERQRSKLLCYDNASAMTQADGGYCLAQGIGVAGFGLALCALWAAQAADLYLKICRRWRRAEILRARRWYWGVAIALPLVVVVLNLGSSNFAATSLLWCAVQAKNDHLALNTYYAALLVLWFAGTVAIISVMRRLYEVRDLEPGRALQERLQTPLRFLLWFSGVWLMIYAMEFTLASNDELDDAYEDWTKCMFANYDATGGGGEVDVCGELPDERLSVEFYGVLLVLTVGQSLMLFVIFGLTKENVEHWVQCLNREPIGGVVEANAADLSDEEAAVRRKAARRTSQLVEELRLATRAAQSYVELEEVSVS